MNTRDLLRRAGPPTLSLAAAGVWLALALANPSLTYHFAPPVVAAAWPIARRTTAGEVPLRSALMVTGAALGIIVATLLALGLSDALEGPTFWSDGGAAWEALTFATVAALWGLRVSTRSRAGLLLG
jgi:hypothetical protein